MDSFSIEIHDEGGVAVIVPRGYCNAEAGEEMHRMVDDRYARDQQTRFVVDFGSCNLINSPGIVAMTDLAMKITEDLMGRVVFCGLDDLKSTVFKMAGTTSYAETAGDRSTAITAALRRKDD